MSILWSPYFFGSGKPAIPGQHNKSRLFQNKNPPPYMRIKRHSPKTLFNPGSSVVVHRAFVNSVNRSPVI